MLLKGEEVGRKESCEGERMGFVGREGKGFVEEGSGKELKWC